MKRLIAILVLTISLTGCAFGPNFNATNITPSSNPAIAIEQQRVVLEDSKRAGAIYYNLAVGGAGMCGSRVRYMSGLTFASRAGSKEWAAAHEAVTGVADNSLHVLDVIPGSGADKAGMKFGDKLLAVNGKSLVGPDGITFDAHKLDIINEQGPRAVFTVLRGDKRMEIKVQQVEGCDFGYVLHLNTRPVTFVSEWYMSTTGKVDNDKIMVMFTGMVEFCKTDDELAVIMGHEMAHLLKNHLKDVRGNLLKNTIWDGTLMTLTQGLYSGDARDSQMRKAEIEADYIGLYFTARAGYDIEQAGPFWKRLEAASPIGKDHPTGEQRDRAARLAADEIKAKRAAGKPLEPGM